MPSALLVACPWCKIGPGLACRDDTTGKPIKGIHPERAKFYWSTSKLAEELKK